MTGFQQAVERAWDDVGQSSVTQRFARRWRSVDVSIRDLSLGILLFAAALGPGFADSGTQIGTLETRPLDVVAVMAVALQTLPLALRRRMPAGCLALVWIGFCIDQLRGYHSIAGIALVVALFSAGAHLDRGRRTAAALSTMTYVALALSLSAMDAGESIGEFVTFYLALALPWGVGSWLRSARDAEYQQRQRLAVQTRATERSRIARELHDIVTHHVTAMVVQAEAARYLTGDPQRLDHSLTAMSDTGRDAINDLRQLLDVLSPDQGNGSRVPTVGTLQALVDQSRRAGQPVDLVEEGVASTTDSSVDLIVHRIVQESLTNALKHDLGGRTGVRIRRDRRAVTVEVSTDGSGTRAGAAGSGRGLTGLRQRIDMIGGELQTSSAADGGFVVKARIPQSSSL